MKKSWGIEDIDIAEQMKLLRETREKIALLKGQLQQQIAEIESRPISAVAMDREKRVAQRQIQSQLATYTALAQVYQGNINLASSLLSKAMSAYQQDLKNELQISKTVIDMYKQGLTSLDKKELEVLRETIRTTRQELQQSMKEQDQKLRLIMNNPVAALKAGVSIEDDLNTTLTKMLPEMTAKGEKFITVRNTVFKYDPLTNSLEKVVEVPGATREEKGVDPTEVMGWVNAINMGYYKPNEAPQRLKPYIAAVLETQKQSAPPVDPVTTWTNFFNYLQKQGYTREEAKQRALNFLQEEKKFVKGYTKLDKLLEDHPDLKKAITPALNKVYPPPTWYQSIGNVIGNFLNSINPFRGSETKEFYYPEYSERPR